MNRSEPRQYTMPASDSARRDSWEELLSGALRARPNAELSSDERWRRLSRHITAQEQLRSMQQRMALHGIELRRMLALARPWVSLFG